MCYLEDLPPHERPLGDQAVLEKKTGYENFFEMILYSLISTKNRHDYAFLHRELVSFSVMGAPTDFVEDLFHMPLF